MHFVLYGEEYVMKKLFTLMMLFSLLCTLLTGCASEAEKKETADAAVKAYWQTVNEDEQELREDWEMFAKIVQVIPPRLPPYRDL